MKYKIKSLISYLITAAVFTAVIVVCLFATGVISGKKKPANNSIENNGTSAVPETDTVTHEYISYSAETSTTIDSFETWYIKDNEQTFEELQPEDYSEAVPVISYDRYVFLGDSRFRGMLDYAEAKDVFVAKNSMGYEYIDEQLSYVQSLCDNHTALIVGLGVNDCGYAASKYLSRLNSMAESMDCQIYFVSVNPVDEAMEGEKYHVKNDTVNSFNEAMKAGLSSKIKYIDSNSYLKSVGYTTRDGLHYVDETSRVIYTYIKSVVG